MTETILICFIADEEMFTGRHRFAEESLRKFMDLFGQESDDVRNIANTKVNPFTVDKNNEVVKYEPMVPMVNSVNNINMNKSRNSNNNFMDFLKVNDVDSESRKVSKFFDPINNTVKIHAQRIKDPDILEEEEEEKEDNDMQKSIKSMNTNNEEEKKSRPDTPVINTPQSQSKTNLQLNTYSGLPQTNNNIKPTPSLNVIVPIDNNSRENNSRPGSQQKNNVFNNSAQNIPRPMSNSSVKSVDNNFNRPNSSSFNPKSKQNMLASKNELKVEDISRPGSSNKNDNINNSVDQKDRSFVEIKKLEIEDLENSNASYENDEDEDKKNEQNSLNVSRDGGEKKNDPFKFKNEDKNKMLDPFNTQFNLDQNRMKNNNLGGKLNISKENPYHF